MAKFRIIFTVDSPLFTERGKMQRVFIRGKYNRYYVANRQSESFTENRNYLKL